jgi:hypothetical protein
MTAAPNSWPPIPSPSCSATALPLTPANCSAAGHPWCGSSSPPTHSTPLPDTNTAPDTKQAPGTERALGTDLWTGRPTLACAGATQTIRIDGNGSPLDVGREHRLYTKQQRTALAARDGGCMFPGCDRPPSWCECHHIMFWARDTGGTDLADGILLCRHHHLLLHNNGWEIHRHDTTYWLIPPPDIDHLRTPIRMHSRSRAHTELLRKRTG